MDRQSINLNGSTIAFYSHLKTSPAIVFLHGNSLSADSFLAQIDDPALQNLSLIAIDLPGHGMSQHVPGASEKYNLFDFRDQVLECLKALKIENFIFAGHSLGGHVAMECLPFAVGCKGLFLWGAPPVALPLDTAALFNPDPRVALLFKSDLSSEEVSKLASLLTKPEYAEEIEKMITQSDPAFREQFPISFMQGKVSDEYLVLTSSGLPFAILHGAQDELVNYNYYQALDLARIWRGKPIIFENSAHSIQIEKPEIFNDLLIQFYSDVFKLN
jgi:pimeloyl-ACP methyl ester carboxylesterase